MKNNLKSIRAERNLSQAQLAKMSGVSRATINTVERGSVVPNSHTLLSISRALQIPVEQIFSDFLLEEKNSNQ